MTVKVSVVTPVYNPGKYLDRCVDSLLAQSLPASEFEVVFVDDGSTDETPARLDELAAVHPHFSVIHIPNSGWPGKPRNIGVAAAKGEYIQYVDQDDRLGSDALRRMYELGHANDADVVLGKVVSNFRRVPHHVFRTNRPRCTAADAPLIDSLTPHKMFRRQFLLDKGIAFPEGKRRLEDQLYMVEAYLEASNVSIVADYPCYFYLRRDDRGNAGSAPIDPSGYYRNLRDVLDAIVTRVPPGEFRDTLVRRFYRVEMLGRLSTGAIKWYDDERFAAVLDEVLRVDAEYMNDNIRDGLDAAYRLRSRAVHTRDQKRIVAANVAARLVGLRARFEEFRWDGDEAVVQLRATLRDGRGRPLRVIRVGDRYWFDPVASLGYDDERIDVTDQLANLSLEVTIRNAASAVEWFCEHDMRATTRVVRRDGDEELLEIELIGSARVRPLADGARAPLGRGTWELFIRCSLLGFGRNSRVGDGRGRLADDTCTPALLGRSPTLVVPYLKEPNGNLTFDVARRRQTLGAAVVSQRVALLRAAQPLRLRLPVATDDATPSTAVRVVAARGSQQLELAADLVPDDRQVVLAVRDGETVPEGKWSLSAALDGDAEPVLLGRLSVGPDGAARLRGVRRSPIPRWRVARSAEDVKVRLLRRIPTPVRNRLVDVARRRGRAGAGPKRRSRGG